MTAAAQFHRAQLAARINGPAMLGHCSRETLRCADARQYGAELRSCCRGHLRQVVADTVGVLREADIAFWADYGTLLGAVRNPLTTWADYPWLSQEGRPAGPLAPGIVPHDKDADFGVLATDWTNLLNVKPALENLGYNVVLRPHGGSIKIRLSAVNHSNLDLFLWREHRLLGQSGILLRRPHYINVDQFKGRDFLKARLEPAATIEWEGLTLPAPSDPEGFCAFRYGPNWRTPIPANHDGVRRG